MQKDMRLIICNTQLLRMYLVGNMLISRNYFPFIVYCIIHHSMGLVSWTWVLHVPVRDASGETVCHSTAPTLAIRRGNHPFMKLFVCVHVCVWVKYNSVSKIWLNHGHRIVLTFNEHYLHCCLPKINHLKQFTSILNWYFHWSSTIYSIVPNTKEYFLKVGCTFQHHQTNIIKINYLSSGSLLHISNLTKHITILSSCLYW